MVSRIAVAGLLIWVSGSTVAQVSTEFSLDKRTYAMGEPIFVNFQRDAVSLNSRKLAVFRIGTWLRERGPLRLAVCDVFVT